MITKAQKDQILCAANLVQLSIRLERKMRRAGLLDSQMLYAIATANAILESKEVDTQLIKDMANQTKRLCQWIQKSL